MAVFERVSENRVTSLKQLKKVIEKLTLEFGEDIPVYGTWDDEVAVVEVHKNMRDSSQIYVDFKSEQE